MLCVLLTCALNRCGAVLLFKASLTEENTVEHLKEKRSQQANVERSTRGPSWACAARWTRSMPTANRPGIRKSSCSSPSAWATSCACPRCSRETSRPAQPSLKLPVATSRPRSSSSQLTNFTKTWQKAWHSQPKRSFAHGLFFLTVLSQRAVADFTPTSCRLSLLLSVKLEAFSTA